MVCLTGTNVADIGKLKDKHKHKVEIIINIKS